MRLGVVVAVVLAWAATWGCERPAGSGGPAAAAAASAPGGSGGGVPAASGTPGAAAATSPVARIAFLGKENACECTRKAIEASWAALQEALGGAAIPVERIQVDTQADQAAPYRSMQAMMAIPGLYFLDASGGLRGMLQGEVTAGEIRAILFPGS